MCVVVVDGATLQRGVPFGGSSHGRTGAGERAALPPYQLPSSRPPIRSGRSALLTPAVWGAPIGRSFKEAGVDMLLRQLGRQKFQTTCTECFALNTELNFTINAPAATRPDCCLVDKVSPAASRRA